MFGSAASMIGIQFCIQHAFSRGYIHINSSSVFDYPAINPNYLSVSYDADIMRAAFKYVRNIVVTAPMAGVIKGETLPGSGVTADADIDSYIAKNSETEYHPTGTNSMLPLAYGGVVNTSLVVYGTTNLRVVDVSVVPMIVAGAFLQRVLSSSSADFLFSFLQRTRWRRRTGSRSARRT
jgi:choline dehydrogenase